MEEIEETYSQDKRQTMCGKPGGKRVGKKEKDGRAKKEKGCQGGKKRIREGKKEDEQV